MSHGLSLDIAGITIALSSDANLPIEIEGAARKFMGGGKPAEVRVHAAWGEPTEPDPAHLLFDPGKGLWRLYQMDGRKRFVFTSPHLGPLPYQSASFNDDFTEGAVEVRRDVFGPRLPLYPLQYPLDELLMVHLLSHGRGVEVHGSGIVTSDGVGTLFAGQSGAGKTTMAKLWLSEPDVAILRWSCVRKATTSGCTERPGTATVASPTKGARDLAASSSCATPPKTSWRLSRRRRPSPACSPAGLRPFTTATASTTRSASSSRWRSAATAAS
jgi:hypothetical protein